MPVFVINFGGRKSKMVFHVFKCFSTLYIYYLPLFYPVLSFLFGHEFDVYRAFANSLRYCNP